MGTSVRPALTRKGFWAERNQVCTDVEDVEVNLTAGDGNKVVQLNCTSPNRTVTVLGTVGGVGGVTGGRGVTGVGSVVGGVGFTGVKGVDPVTVSNVFTLGASGFSTSSLGMHLPVKLHAHPEVEVQLPSEHADPSTAGVHPLTVDRGSHVCVEDERHGCRVKKKKE